MALQAEALTQKNSTPTRSTKFLVAQATDSQCGLERTLTVIIADPVIRTALVK